MGPLISNGGWLLGDSVEAVERSSFSWASSPRKVDDAVVCFGGEFGGDYFAEQAGIDLTYKGSGQYTADRVGVTTGPP